MINMVVFSMYGVHQKKGVTPRGRQAERQLPKGLDLFLQPVTLVRAPTFAILARAALALPR